MDKTFDEVENQLQSVFEGLAKIVMDGLGEPQEGVNIMDAASDLLQLGMCLGRRVALLGADATREFIQREMIASK